MMKSALPIAVVAMALSACVQLPAPVIQNNSGSNTSNVPDYSTITRTTVAAAGKYKLTDSHWSDVSKIREEARRLNQQVGSNRMTKVQAAQYLNRFRLNLVGSNSVDDPVYEMYLRSVVDSQRGVIDSTQSKANVESALRGWQQRWKHMDSRPTNPAFTNFLLELMGMEPLK